MNSMESSDPRVHSRYNLNASNNSASLRSTSCKFSGKNYRNLDPTKKVFGGSKRNSSQHSSLSLAAGGSGDEFEDSSLGDFGFKARNDEYKRHTLLTKSRTEANGFVSSKLISLKELRKSFKSLIDDFGGPSEHSNQTAVNSSPKSTSQQQQQPPNLKSSLNIKFNRLQLMNSNKLIPPSSSNLK